MGDDDLPPWTLPDDVVQDEVLRLLPRGALAVCRCVCKAWRDGIDSRRMLRSDLLPLGIFLNLNMGFEAAPPLLFAPPSMGRKVAADFRSFVKMEHSMYPVMCVVDCCNGLLLVEDGHVVNPATRRWAAPPWPCPAADEDDYDVYHLLFDPCVSPHFQVLVFREMYYWRASETTTEDGSAEWPPSLYMMWVYSSETRRWEETPFVREGGPAGTLAEARSAEYVLDYNRAVYYHGALYAKCKGNFIMRITLSDCKYQVIKLPEDVCASLHTNLHLVKSKCGVYVAIISSDCGRHLLWVWLLIESSGRAEWMLKYNINLQGVGAQFPANREYSIDGPWIINGKIIHGEVCNSKQAIEEDEFEWDFDKDNILNTELKDEKYHPGRITILGFHPYKEFAFLHELSEGRVVAFHLDGSKVQDLGPLKNPYPFPSHDSDPTAYFVYTPCWMERCLEQN